MEVIIMFILTAIAAITGASVASGIAAGSFMGAGIGLAATIHESQKVRKHHSL